jgi:hypothetical protein
MDANLVPELVGLLIPLAGIAFPLVVIFLVLQFRERERNKLHETLRYFADRGMPVPRELLDPPRPESKLASAPRFVAFSLVGVGVGIMLMFASMDLMSLIGIGALVVCVGVAQLLALALDARDAKKAQPPRPDTAA